MKAEFSTLDIVKALEIPRERLRNWMDKGFVVPSIPSERQGSAAVFDLRDVYAIELFRRLIERARFARGEAARFTSEWLTDAKKRPVAAVALYNVLFFVRDDKGITFMRSASLLGGPYGDELNLYLDLQREIANEFRDSGRALEIIYAINFKKIKAFVDGCFM